MFSTSKHRRLKNTKRRGGKAKRVRSRSTNTVTDSTKESRQKVTPVLSQNPPVYASTMNTEDISSDEVCFHNKEDDTKNRSVICCLSFVQEPTDYELLLSSLQPLKKRPRRKEKEERQTDSAVVAEGDLVSDEAASEVEESEGSDESDGDNDAIDKGASKGSMLLLQSHS